jgi:hypothetical protein
MFVRKVLVDGAVPVPPAPPVNFSMEKQVQSGFNLILPLKNPAQMPALLATLQLAKPAIYEQLRELHYIHFARFLPLPDGSALLVVTTYDGDLNSYIMDFVAVLADVFDQVFVYLKDAPPLPVKDYPVEFVNYVIAHNEELVGVWSAYPDLTLIDIIGLSTRP